MDATKVYELIMSLKPDFEKCMKGEHFLPELYRFDTGLNCEAVVRYCEVCGAIVIDRESDNRNFGRYMKMKGNKTERALRDIFREDGLVVSKNEKIPNLLRDLPFKIRFF